MNIYTAAMTADKKEIRIYIEETISVNKETKSNNSEMTTGSSEMNIDAKEMVHVN